MCIGGYREHEQVVVGYAPTGKQSLNSLVLLIRYPRVRVRVRVEVRDNPRDPRPHRKSAGKKA
jgi:hypothetical protein